MDTGSRAPEHERSDVALAADIASREDIAAIGGFIDVLGSGTDRQRTHALKMLHEVGERRPDLIAPHAQVFIDLLAGHTKGQRRAALLALEAIAAQRADAIVAELPRILDAADKGSVTAKDCCTTILVKLASAGHADETVPILIERLRSAAPRQFASYAEETAMVIDEARRPGFLAVLGERIGRMSEDNKRRRVERLMRKMGG